MSAVSLLTPKHTTWTLHGVALAVVLIASASDATATRRSALSYWLSDTAVPEIHGRLSEHPRYANQPIHIIPLGQDGLAVAIATLLESNLAGQGSIADIRGKDAAATPARSPRSIDTLACSDNPAQGYRLTVTVNPQAGRPQLTIQLVEVPSGEIGDQWHWQGRLNSEEKSVLQTTEPRSVGQGDLTAPWGTDQVSAAAAQLARELVCDLRPQVATITRARWRQDPALPPPFADIFSASQHYVGSYRELDLRAGEVDFTIETRVKPFSGDIWQLWLLGIPRNSQLRGIQAVTYVKAQGTNFPAIASPRPADAPSTLATPLPPGKAGDYLHVELLDATQTDGSGHRAQLQLQLRLENRAAWPLEYSFTTSGGHFEQCIPRPGYYRHDNYGSTSGTLQAGENRTQRLLINRARHHPTPLFGTPRCAGFRDIDSFENFVKQGYRVTDYVRWQPQREERRYVIH